MKTITALLCCFTLCTASAQQLDWAYPFGHSSSPSYFDDVATDAALNIVVSGSFQGTMDLDLGPGTANLASVAANSLFLAKYDSYGDYLWAFKLDISSGYGQPTNVECDASGNIVMSGPLYGSADFDPGPGTALLSTSNFGYGDIFVAVYDPSGNLIRCTSFGGGGSENVNDLKLDVSGNIYMTGTTAGTFMIIEAGDTIINSSYPSSDMFIIKMDTSLVCEWATSMEGTSYTQGLSLAVYSNGDIAVAGLYHGTTIDADPGPGTNILTGTSYASGFLARYDQSGGHIWAFGIATNTSAPVYFQGIAINSAGTCYVAGLFSISADFDPGSNTTILQAAPGNNNMFVAAYNSSGGFVKAFSAGEGDARWISLDPAGNVFVTGHFTSPVDFDPGPGTAAPVSQGTHSTFVARYNDTLGYLNVLAIGSSPGYSTGKRGTCDANGNYITVGYFNGSNVDFDPGTGVVQLSSVNVDYCYFAKYLFGPASTEQHTQEIGIHAFPNPASGSVTIELNTVDAFTSTNGQMSVYDPFGKVVHSESTAGRSRILIETDSWTPGIYVVNIASGESHHALKLVVE